jgi:hypothetical protein
MKIEHLITELGKAKVRATAPGAAPAGKTLSMTPNAIRKRNARAAGVGQPLPTTDLDASWQNIMARAEELEKNMDDLAGLRTTQTPAQPTTQPAAAPTTQTPAQPTTQPRGPGLGSKIATGVGRFVQGTGNLASQVAGAVTQPIGAAFGGLKKGFRTANRGETFKLPNQRDYAPSQSRSYEPSQDDVSGSAELADLKSMIQRIDQRLTNAGIKETKKS